MAVMITVEVKGQTQQGYDSLSRQLETLIRRAPGFVLHAAHPTPDGWRVIEVWASKDDADRFFSECVAPNLPTGIWPKRHVQELHSLLGP